MINILQGMNTVVSPASPMWKDGVFTTCTNMRVDLNGRLVTAAHTITVPTRTVYADDGVTNYTTSTINDGLAPQAMGSVANETNAVGARMESGIYYYIATAVDTTNGGESVASSAVEWYVQRNYNGLDVRVDDVPKITMSSGSYRIYRTKVIYIYKGATLQRVQKNSPTEFFYVGSITSGTVLYDYLHDDELGEQYEGRGSKAPDTINVIQAFDGRMFAFYSGYARYSAVGRPTEFPQAHNITYDFKYTDGVWAAGIYNESLTAAAGTDRTITFYPRLENGLEAETRLWMPEIIGDTVVDAYEFKGKLWVWTAFTTGYITPVGNGYRYVHLTENFGAIASTICVAEDVMYGCDNDSTYNGAWVLDGNFPKRLTYGIVAPASITGAQWNNATKEYLFGIASGSADVYIYNARLGVTTSRVVPATGTYPTEILLWFQFKDEVVKENIRVTIITEAGNYDCIIYQGNFPAVADCVSSGTYSFSTATNKVNVIRPNNSGRYIGIKITAAAASGLIITGINVEPKPTSEYERNRR